MLHTKKRAPLDENLTLRFTLPIILENTLTMAVGLAFSRIISTISASALAAIGMANSVMNVVNALFTMLSMGAVVLVSRQIGARDGEGAAETIEQGALLGILCSVTVTALCFALSAPLMRLLMPNAEPQMLREALRYFRILLLSLPFLALHGMFSSICRALGDSRSSFLVAIVMNVVQLAAAYVCIQVLHLEEIGAGLAWLICRITGMTLLAAALLRSRRFFVLKLSHMRRAHGATFARILRVGVPVSIEQVLVQLGYMLASTMSIALGTFESGVYQIMNTLNTFMTLPQGIVQFIGLTAVGHLLGANREKDARHAGLRLWAIGLGTTLVLSIFMLVWAKPLCGIYSSDPAAVARSSGWLWILLVMDLAGVSINAIDPQLRAGGDVKFVMYTTLCAVWLIRLPLTYAFCFWWKMGSFGIFLANTVSLYFRAVMGLCRHRGSKWIRKV